jgi:hypothetical protein
VVFYESRNLKENAWNYAMHELELKSIIHVLNMWRHYLVGRRFELSTDHNSLKYLFGQSTLNVRHEDGYNSLVNTNLILNISNSRRIK